MPLNSDTINDRDTSYFYVFKVVTSTTTYLYICLSHLIKTFILLFIVVFAEVIEIFLLKQI